MEDGGGPGRRGAGAALKPPHVASDAVSRGTIDLTAGVLILALHDRDQPPFRPIAEPLREMAERAAEMIDRLTAGEKVAPRHVTLPVQLIERDSVA